MSEEPSQQEIKEQQALFDEVEEVVADPLRFKSRLGIGSDAYLTMRVGKRLQSLWDVGGFAVSGAGVAASSTVATTFFSAGGWLGALGLGAAATTPIGWVLGAAAASGAAYYGVSRVFTSYGSSRVDTIPKFINTPIDILGSKLVDLVAPLAIKLARIDGDYDARERQAIIDYFVKDWGISDDYARAAITTIEANTSDQSLNSLVAVLADFKKANPDCNYEVMCKDLVAFLRQVAEADNRLDEREEMTLEKVEQILLERGRFSFNDLLSMLPTLRGESKKAPS